MALGSRLTGIIGIRRRDRGVHTALADRRRYERQIDRLHQRHLFDGGLYRLTDGEVDLATVVMHRGHVARLLARSVEAGEYRLRPATIRTIVVDGRERQVFDYPLLDLIVHGVVAEVLAEAVEPRLSRVSIRIDAASRRWTASRRSRGTSATTSGRGRDPRSRGVYVLRRDVDSYTDSIPLGAGAAIWAQFRDAVVLSTGSELVAPGTPLQPGQIYESNGPMLAAAVEDAGGVAELLRFVPDDVAHLHRVVDEHLAAGTVDLVLTSGGISAGAYEVVKEGLGGRGVEFVKVAMQPGGPQGVGRVNGVGVVALPGNPVSSHVSFEVFVRPVLRAALGHPYPDRPRITAPLAAALTSTAGRRQFRRGVLDAVAGTVREVGGPPSHLLAALARADCFFVVPEEVTELAAGVPVEVWLLES